MINWLDRNMNEFCYFISYVNNGRTRDDERKTRLPIGAGYAPFIFTLSKVSCWHQVS